MEPQLGKPSSSAQGSAVKTSPDEQSAKRIRQAVYDIRYRARREDIGVDQAYSQYMANTSMAANEKSSVREKLGLGPGGQVSEDAKPGEHYLRVDPRKRGTGEKPYVKKYDPKNPKDRAKRHSLIKKGIVTTVTKHGQPYDGAGEKYEKKYGPSTGKNTKGDLDKDGTIEPDRHEYAGVKDNAIKKSMKKESFYSWKDELREIVEKIDDIRDKEIKEKTIKNKIIVNPNIKTEEIATALGAELLESVNLGENYIEELLDFATEHFYLEGLNENGIDILVEDIGVDNFSDYVFDLDEARRSGRIDPVTKTGKDVGSLKGGAKTAAIKRLRGEKEKRREAEASASASSTKPSGMTAALRSQSEKSKVVSKLKKAKTEKSIERAKQSQKPSSNKSSEGTKKEVKKGILGHLKQSWQTAREVGKEHEKRVARAAGTAAGAVHGAAKAVHRAGQEFGKSETGQKLKKGATKTAKATAAAAGAGIGSKVAGKSAAAAAGRAAGTFIRKMREDFDLWINELIDEGYDIEEYDFADLVELYIPEEIHEGLGTAVSNVLFGTKEQQLAKARSEREKRKESIAARSPQRKTPSQPIKKPNTPERDPWSGNPETDKAWAKGGSASSTPRAYRREEFEEWMESFLEEFEVNENMLFLIFESDLMSGEFLNEDGDPCWKGYTQVGMKKKGGREVPNCVPSKGVEKAKGYKKEEVDLEEKAPPGAKFERMVKHIKKGYAKKGGLTKSEKSIAYATAWKAKNEEVEIVHELNRYEKETGKDYKTGNPSTPGGSWKNDPVMRHMNKVMGSERLGVQPRGQKKVPGKKPPTAGEYGSTRHSPEQIVKNRRAQKQAAQDMMHSRFD
jgi:hypothetical protein